MDSILKHYAPNKKVLPPSLLSAKPPGTRKCCLIIFLIIDLGCFAGFVGYYSSVCTGGYGTSSCLYAADKEWEMSIIRQPGVRWIECYDTEGILGTTLMQALDSHQSEDAAFKSLLVCGGGMDYELSEDIASVDYSADYCCNGYFSASDCTPADHCYNNNFMCEWKTCPSLMSTIALANSAFSGAHAVLLVCIGFVLRGALDPKTPNQGFTYTDVASAKEKEASADEGQAECGKTPEALAADEGQAECGKTPEALAADEGQAECGKTPEALAADEGQA